MRFVWVLLLVVSLLPGCKHANPIVAPDAMLPGKKPKPAPPRRGHATPTAASPTDKFPRATPFLESKGKVRAIHSTSRFVVIDFYLSRLPQIGQRMNLYRQGLKVGEVKISGPEMSQYIAADIVAGDAQVGDEVRVE